jgi:peptidoglycan/LPS O-acetylase OafA/YrhL
MAVIYLLIGLGVFDIGASTSGETVDLAVFGFSAGIAYVVLALLLTFSDRRWIWVLAALLMLWVYVIYLSASGSREPPFELWGLTLRVIQLPLLAALIYLSWKPSRSTTQESAR